MTVQSCQTRQEAERAVERLRAIGLPVAMLSACLEDGMQTRRVWEVVIPQEYAQFAAHALLERAEEGPAG
ncbi:MAG: hypothetical protein Q8N47_26550 [Bryobacterales bacterium]|nr:hypothetical protein [Bryobacterales bacterium]